VLIGRHLELPDWDRPVRNIAYLVLLILAAELIIGFIIEFYRPRTREERPIFESRLLALFTEPGGVVRNVAGTLDYQFGFQASSTWIYQFAERAVVPLLLAWAISLWLLTAIAEVGYGEVGVRERFGRALLDRPPLPPGLYLKLPWPGERIARYPVGELREISIGSQVSEATVQPGQSAPLEVRGKNTEVVLWTVSHYAKESRYLVATDPSPKVGEDSVSGEDVPVSFLSALLPVQYRIRDVIAFAYRHHDAPATLRALAEREVADYLASADLLKVMSTGRGEATRILAANLQAAADAIGLGVEIVYVNLHDAHPPVEKVAPSFQEVVGAREEKESEILRARSYEQKILPETRGEANRLVASAEAYASRTVKVSEAEAERFQQQALAYRIMPEMYLLRCQLEFLEKDCAALRKFLVPAARRDEVFVLNLEEKVRLDLLSTDLSDLREEKKK